MPAQAGFFLSGAVVVMAGIRLARDGDVIAERTGLGAAWIGPVLVAGATSLPQFLTDFFAVRQGHIGLAVGDLFGSSMANMLILAGADLVWRKRRILTRVAINQALVGLLAIAVTTVAAVGILTDGDLAFAGLGWAPLVAAASYLGGMRLLYANRREPPFTASEETAAVEESMVSGRSELLRPALGFAIAAFAILLAAPFLASSAATIADQLGVSTGVIGIALLAVATSLPEVSVTVASMRAGSNDLAVGNLLGSNCFNMALLLPLALLDGGPLLAGAGPNALVGALFAVVLTTQTLVEVLNAEERRLRWLEQDLTPGNTTR